MAGQLDKAISLLKLAWSERKKSLEPGHPFTLRSQMNLATAYSYASSHEEAVQLLEEALVVAKAKYGEDHVDSLTAMHSLASAYQSARRFEKALPLLKRTLEKRRSKLGADHPDTLATQHNLATVYWRLGKLDRSIPLFEDTVTGMRRTWRDEHPDTLQALVNLGINYRDAGRYPEAIRCLEEVGAKSKADAFSSRLEWIRMELANTYSQSGQPAKAEPLYREAMERRGKDDPTRAGFMAQLSLMLLRQRKFAEADPVLRELLAIRSKAPAEDWNTFNVRSMLGEALSGQGKYRDAEPLLVGGYEGMKQRAQSVPPGGYWLFDQALERLIRHYKAVGKNEEVMKWQKELESIQSARKSLEKKD
jgi:tetratricopeptide (TPR) repeat protein